MENKTQTTQNYEVKTGRSEISVPYKDGKLVFIHPSFGLESYWGVARAVVKAGLKLPTSEHSASLVHAAYCGPKEFTETPQVTNIGDIMKRGGLWIANRNLWTPTQGKNPGVYVVLDEKGVGTMSELRVNDLEKELEDCEEVNGIRFSKNEKVRFAPRDTYKDGEQTPDELAKNGFVIASYGVKGAEQLAEVSRKFSYLPVTWILEPKHEAELRVSALDANYDAYSGYRLHVRADGGRYGHAFGVLEMKTAEAPEKNWAEAFECIQKIIPKAK